MLNVFLVGIGGMVGSMLRYGVSMLPMECGRRHVGSSAYAVFVEKNR